MLALLAAALLRGSPAAAADKPVRSPEVAGLLRQLSALQDKDAADCARLEGLVAEMETLGRRFPSTAEPPAVMLRFAAANQSYSGLTMSIHERLKEEDRVIASMQMAGIATSVSVVMRRRGLPEFAARSDELTRYQLRTDGMLVRVGAIDDRAARAAGEFRDRLDERREAQVRRHYVLWGGAAAAATALAGLFFGLRGRRETVVWTLPSELPGTPAAPSPPDGYEVGRLLGRGAVGEVYEAFDTTLQRRVALKRLRPELCADPREAERLLAEARTVASLRHPNIAALHAVERREGRLDLVFELVDGETLERTLAKTGRLVPSQALRVLKECAAALDAAHARGVVHRDVRPANVMLARTGEAKVMDFGLASEAKRTLARLTRATSWGTPAYMAPEQELGAVTPAVDTWALAVCYYETLTGEVPFKGPDFLTQKRERLYAPATTLAPGLPAGLDALLARAFDPDPARRFPSAGALAAAAEAALA